MHDKESLVAALETLLSVLHSMPEGKMGGDEMKDPDMDGDDDSSPATDTDHDMGTGVPKTKVDVAMLMKKPMPGESEGGDEDDDLETLKKRPGYLGKLGK